MRQQSPAHFDHDVDERTACHRMQLIGVVDLKAGRAVRARGGLRETLRPGGDDRRTSRSMAIRWRSAAPTSSTFGLNTLYAADLDAIAGGEMQR